MTIQVKVWRERYQILTPTFVEIEIPCLTLSSDMPSLATILCHVTIT